MDKITVTQDDVEAAKDEGATFVLEKLAKMVGVSDWSIQDGSESWEGDVSATAYHILVQAKVINDWDNSVARHQTDAQMAAPDGLAGQLAALYEAATKGDLETAGRTREEWIKCPVCDGAGEVESKDYCNFDHKALGVQFYGIGNEFGAHEKLWSAVMQNMPAILASLSASNVMRDALTKARRELYLLSLNEGARDHEIGVLITQIDAALAGQGTTLDRQTVEACKRAVRDRMVEQEWPPTDGDRQIDEVLEALDDLIEARASMDPNHVR